MQGDDEHIREADKISHALWPLLSKALGGRAPEVQGLVLADLTAIFIAGHSIEGEPATTVELHEQLLKTQCDAVRDLVLMYAAGTRRPGWW
ncbi:MAG TPA: hypothetical protein VGH25_13310 [Dongiaceae bacterium]|jgi:hypothetical protein